MTTVTVQVGDRTPTVGIDALHSFVVAAGCKSLREAAEKLHVTPPAFATRISKLESQLGVMLFERNRQGIRLTTDGRQILDFAQRTIKSVSRLEEYAAMVRAGTEGVISVACYPVHVERFLANALGEFRRRQPAVRVDLSQMRDDRRRTWGRSLFEELRDGDVDLAMGPPHLEPELSLTGIKVYDANIVALVPDDDAFRNEQKIPIESLAGRKILVSPEGFFSRERLSQAAQDAGVSLDIAIQSSSPTALLALGHHGMGLPVLPDDYPLVGQQRFPYPVACDSAGRMITTEVWLHWRSGSVLSPAMTSFIEVVQELIEEEVNLGRKYEEYYRSDMSGRANRFVSQTDIQ